MFPSYRASSPLYWVYCDGHITYNITFKKNMLHITRRQLRTASTGMCTRSDTVKCQLVDRLAILSRVQDEAAFVLNCTCSRHCRRASLMQVFTTSKLTSWNRPTAWPHNIILLPLQISKPVLSSSQFCGSNYCALQKIINANEMTAKKWSAGNIRTKSVESFTVTVLQGCRFMILTNFINYADPLIY